MLCKVEVLGTYGFAVSSFCASNDQDVLTECRSRARPGEKLFVTTTCSVDVMAGGRPDVQIDVHG